MSNSDKKNLTGDSWVVERLKERIAEAKQLTGLGTEGDACYKHVLDMILILESRAPQPESCPDAVSRKRVWDLIKKYYGQIAASDPKDKMLEMIEKLPSVLPTLDQERIEAAIRYFDPSPLEKTIGPPLRPVKMCLPRDVADLCRYFLNQEQPTWTDKDFGLPQRTRKSFTSVQDKRGGVMKLYKQIPCRNCDGDKYVRGQDCPACDGSGVEYKSVNPADLAALNLAAVRVLEELQETLEAWKELADEENVRITSEALKNVLLKIKTLKRRHLSPSALLALGKDMELAAVRVLEELKQTIGGDSECILDLIALLESKHLSPSALLALTKEVAEIREMQEWAKAWRWALERRYITFSQREECELQARYELDKEDTPASAGEPEEVRVEICTECGGVIPIDKMLTGPLGLARICVKCEKRLRQEKK